MREFGSDWVNGESIGRDDLERSGVPSRLVPFSPRKCSSSRNSENERLTATASAAMALVPVVLQVLGLGYCGPEAGSGGTEAVAESAQRLYIRLRKKQHS